MLDALHLVEAAYREAKDEHEWLTNLIDAGRVVDRGMGVYGQTYYFGSNGATIFTLIGRSAPPPPALDRLRVSVGEFERERGLASLEKLFPRRPRVGGWVELSGLSPQAVRAEFSSVDTDWGQGKADALGILAGDPSGYGCLLCAASPVPVKTSPRETRLLTHVAVHIAHGHRLVRERARAAPIVDAVLDPDGRVQHLESAHVTAADSAALASAARRVDRARGRLRRASPDEALGLWRGLVEGRWTLVDHVDHDGRRYVFAQRNAPVVHGWESLSEREKQVVVYAARGHSQKLIAYELDLALSTVGHHLATAARKVGVRSRLALLSAWRREHGETNGAA